MLEKELMRFGLDEKEARVFLCLLAMGPSGMSEIARKTGMNRTTLYAVFDRLSEKQLLTYSIRGKRKVYVAESPERVRTIIGEQLSVFDGLLPELLSVRRERKHTPVLKCVEGLDGIKAVFLDSLRSKDNTIVGFSGIEALSSTNGALRRFWDNEYVPKRKQKKKFVRLIVPENEAGRAFRARDAEQYRESKMVSGSRYNFECEIHAYDDTVTFISYSKDEEFAAQMISKPIANTVKMLFQIIWTVAY